MSENTQLPKTRKKKKTTSDENQTQNETQNSSENENLVSCSTSCNKEECLKDCSKIIQQKNELNTESTPQQEESSIQNKIKNLSLLFDIDYLNSLQKTFVDVALICSVSVILTYSVLNLFPRIYGVELTDIFHLVVLFYISSHFNKKR